jgi:hypothetical protein
MHCFTHKIWPCTLPLNHMDSVSTFPHSASLKYILMVFCHLFLVFQVFFFSFKFWKPNFVYISHLFRTRYIAIYLIFFLRPLWSSGQSSWLQIRRLGFDSQHYQIFWGKKTVVGLERGPLSLVSTTEELLDRKVAAPVYKIENTAVRIRYVDNVAPSIRKSWQSLRRQAAVARSVQFARGLSPWSFFFIFFYCM